MEELLVSMAKGIFSLAVEHFKSKGDTEEQARAKAANMLEDAPRRVEIDRERLEKIAAD